MPGLDVSFMTADPLLSDCFNVTRRKDVVGSNGRTTPTVEKVYKNVRGVVTQQDPSDLMRMEQGQAVPRKIFIATKFAVQGAIVGYQPDVITWNGTDYVVTSVLPYGRFGAGTYEVVAESETATDVKQ